MDQDLLEYVSSQMTLEAAVSGGPASGNEPRLQSLQEVEWWKGEGGGGSRTMESVGNGVCEGGGRKEGREEMTAVAGRSNEISC